MLIDHICYFYPPDNPIVIFFNFISRLTAPTMALFIAEDIIIPEMFISIWRDY